MKSLSTAKIQLVYSATWVVIALGGILTTTTAIADSPACEFNKRDYQCREKTAPHSSDDSKLTITRTVDGIAVVNVEDWGKKDIKLPWDQVVLDQSFGSNEYVVFSKAFKFKVGWVSNRKERIHVRWTQNQVELFVFRGLNCSLLFGCETGTSYLLPKRIKISLDSQDYFLKSVDANTYALTPEFKTALVNNNSVTAASIRLDERINFELEAPTRTALHQLMMVPAQSTTP
jgi:hypothetical protein